jgi:sugar phosphate permease
MSLYRNPLIVGLWGPAYLVVGAITVTNDFLMAAMWLMVTLGLLGAYVSETRIFSGLYANEVMHKVAVSSLLGVLFGMLAALGMAPSAGGNGIASVSPSGKFLASWVAMSIPAYLMMVWLVSRLNKRDLEAEHAVRMEKRKNRKSSGPPILNREDGGL